MHDRRVSDMAHSITEVVTRDPKCPMVSFTLIQLSAAAHFRLRRIDVPWDWPNW